MGTEITIPRYPAGAQLRVNKLGNDDSGTRGNLVWSYLTLGAAKAAAQSGDTIVVGPGVYNEKNLLKNGVSWHFEAGATINYTGTTDGGVFDDSADGANGPVVCKITGYGEFYSAPASGIAPTFYIQDPGSFLEIECISIGGDNDDDVPIFLHTAGVIGVKCFRLFSLGLTTTVFWQNGKLEIQCHEITAQSWPVWSEVENGAVVTGDMHIQAFRIETSGNYPAITFNDDNANARVWINAQIIIGAYTGMDVGKGSVVNGAKYYVTAQKITHNPTDAGAYGTIQLYSGNLYLTVQKMTQPSRSSDCGIFTTGTGTTFLSAEIGTMEFLGDSLNAVQWDNANATGEIRIGSCTVSSSAGGLVISAGTLSLQNCYINTAANIGTNPINKTGGTLRLYGTTLVAEATRDSIEATGAQNVMAIASWTNKAVDANVTITTSGGLVVDSNVA